MATSIVIMSACPINLFDPILLYLLHKLKGYSGRKPRVLFKCLGSILATTKNEGLVLLWVKLRCGFCCKQCLSP